MKKPSKKKAASELESHLGFWLRYVSNHVSAGFAALTEENGVTVSEWVVMRQLYDRGTVGAADLIAALGMTKGAISKILTRLQQKGLVQRDAAEGDMRAQALSLTAGGQALVPKLAALADRNDADFFGHLSARQRAELMAILMDVVEKRGLKQVPLN